MGEQADYEIDRLENRALYPFGVDVLFHDSAREKNRAFLAEYVWTAKDGSRVKFKDMTLSHLRNVVRIQEREKNKHAPQLRDYYEYRVTLEAS